MFDLLDAVAANIKDPDNPDFINIPSESDSKNIASGSHVKLGFLTGKISKRYKVEYLWVLVHSKEHSEDMYYGRLDSMPNKIQKIRIGDDIQFSSKNVVDIINN